MRQLIVILLSCVLWSCSSGVKIWYDPVPAGPSEEPSVEPSDEPSGSEEPAVSEDPSEEDIASPPANFPQIRITTNGGKPVEDRENYINGSITYLDPDHIYSSTEKVTSTMKIRGRGNSTWDFFPKKPYRVKMDNKLSVFGIHADKDWILLAEYSDKTLLHNRFGMELSKICGMYWTPQMRSVEVWFNDVYDGVYTLSEHKEVNGHKVDISDKGFYLEIGEDMNEPVCFFTAMGIPIMFKEPSEPTAEQQDYVKGCFKAFEDALAVPWKGEYRSLIDVDSFVNFFIVEELCKNPDGNLRRSSFMTLDTDKKLTMYHVWDFDLAFGNCDFFTSLYGLDASPTGWFVKNYNRDGRDRGWYWKLFQDPYFVEKVKRRWKEVYPRLKDITSYIDEQALFLSEAQARNFQRWPIMGVYVWPNAKVAKTYEGEIYNLWDFYYLRLDWMDAQINSW